MFLDAREEAEVADPPPLAAVQRVQLRHLLGTQLEVPHVDVLEIQRKESVRHYEILDGNSLGWDSLGFAGAA